jgi:hypothetical protein
MMKSAKMIFCIPNVLQKKILDKIIDLNFFGLMFNESTNVIITEHLVILATFVEDRFFVSVFLDLL